MGNVRNVHNQNHQASTNSSLWDKTTFKERQCEFGHLIGSRSPNPVIVPIYLQKIQLCQHNLSIIWQDNHIYQSSYVDIHCKQNQKKWAIHLRTLDSSVSNTIRKRIPTETCKL